MKTYIKKISIVLAIAFVAVACDDSFLDTKPITASAPETFYTTVESVDLAVTTCYSIFEVEKVWDLTIMMTFGSIASDEAEAGAGGKGDVVQFQNIDQLRHAANEPQVFEQTFGYLYRAIGACNVAIERIIDMPNVIDVTEEEQEFLDKRLAEAYFLRAINYFYLSIIYGGVPLVDRVLGPSDYQMPRAPISDVYALIKSDLRKAIPDLPTKSEWGDQVGRASKGAAQALLAKAYLFESSYAKNYPGDERFTGLEESWDSVTYWAEEVINSGEYELIGLNGETFTTWRDPEDAPGTTPGWRYIFMVAANNSREGVFEIQSRNDGLGWFQSRGTALCTWCAPRVIVTDDAGTTTAFGWGWWCPSPQLEAAFNPDDPRKDYTILDATDSVLTASYGWVGVNFDELEGGTGLTSNSHKYEVGPEEVEVGPSNWPMGPTNIKIIRIADVYLMAAEAYMEQDNNAKALEYVNLIRQRARLSGNTGEPAPLTGTITLQDIMDERLFELSMEGHRFFDLVRWNKANEYLDHTLANDDQIEFVEGKHDFFPLPEQEVLKSGGSLQQYPGW